MTRLILITLTLLGAVTPAAAQDGTAAAAGLTAEYYHVDAIGSVRVVTNQAGAVVRRHDYLPFGEEWQPQSGSNDARRFSGKERDSETGLDYFGARYYGASVGRFTTIDPVQTWKENLVDPQRWNRYVYVRNNPLRYVDPDGRCAVPAGLRGGQVGICIESFIGAKRIGGVGLGDNRSFEPNDPKATYRTSLRLILDPASGEILSQELKAGTSEIGFGSATLGLPGRTTLTGGANTDGAGTRLSFSMTGQNGWAFANMFGDIEMAVNLHVSKSGDVKLGPSVAKGFPSYEGYSYRYVDGRLVIGTLFQQRENAPRDLKGPLTQTLGTKK